MPEFDESGKFTGIMPGGGHGHHGETVQSSRRFAHGGHDVEVRAVYTVLVDGVARQLHFSVGPDGKATSHLTPYVKYASLVDMVKALIDRFPEDFVDADATDDDGHGGHGHA